jgi:Protein of unknown function, DUF417
VGETDPNPAPTGWRLLFLGTLSFLFTTPGVTAAGGFPVKSVLPGQFLLKDPVLLGASVWTLGDSLAAINSLPGPPCHDHAALRGVSYRLCK